MVVFMKSKKCILIDNETTTLVDLPSGKISVREKRMPIQPQRSVSCLLYSMRRIAFFNDPDVRHSNLYKAFRRIKLELKNFRGDYDSLYRTLKELCGQLNINCNQVITHAKSYSEFEKERIQIQCSLLYEALIKQRFYPLFHLHDSGWHPDKGFIGLKESLATHGAHVFIGKFGAWCHRGEDKLVRFSSEDTTEREAYAFKKDSYAGDSTTWTHAVIVDMVKIINDREMVFFRDPYDYSGPDAKEKVYVLSYEMFIQRLTNQQSHRYARKQCEYETNFGIVSSDPDSLLKI
ncbi:Uncharacterised protein [Legionella wadsworthii]|uniref:Uncharacterized protein n=2 Tax=Legionella wadsworthii TaxID=28088 RepID=A0A378LUZ6_9GAMM|nr:Uncharacterised protein [Legionella wadsworthii]